MHHISYQVTWEAQQWIVHTGKSGSKQLSIHSKLGGSGRQTHRTRSATSNSMGRLPAMGDTKRILKHSYLVQFLSNQCLCLWRKKKCNPIRNGLNYQTYLSWINRVKLTCMCDNKCSLGGCPLQHPPRWLYFEIHFLKSSLFARNSSSVSNLVLYFWKISILARRNYYFNFFWQK